MVARAGGGASSAPGPQAVSRFPWLFPWEAWSTVGAQQTFVVGQWGGEDGPVHRAEELVALGL